jgi:hypothetical protein
MPNPKEIVIHNLYNVLWKVPLNCWTYLCRNACSHALHRRLRRSGVKRDWLLVRQAFVVSGMRTRCLEKFKNHET